MKTFLIRTLSGIVYAAVIFGSIFTRPEVFAIVTFCVLLLGLGEFHLISKKLQHNPGKSILFLFPMLLFLTGMLLIFKIIPVNFFILLAVPVLLIFILPVFDRSGHTYQNTGTLLIATLYIALPLLCLNFLFYQDLNFNQPVIHFLIGIFVITWINDSFAYMVGSLLGKHKLPGHLSPNKTWEGSFGGFIFSLGGAYVLSILFPGLSWIEWIGFASVAVVFGTFGDLFESMLKRSAGLKESGDLIPGHGGILDRFDSLLLAAPFVLIYVNLVSKAYAV